MYDFGEKAHDVSHPPRYRDFRTPGLCSSPVLLGLNAGLLRIFEVGSGADGYDVSSHLFSNSVDADGINYIDLISHRHQMRWGGW